MGAMQFARLHGTGLRRNDCTVKEEKERKGKSEPWNMRGFRGHATRDGRWSTGRGEKCPTAREAGAGGCLEKKPDTALLRRHLPSSGIVEDEMPFPRKYVLMYGRKEERTGKRHGKNRKKSGS